MERSFELTPNGQDPSCRIAQFLRYHGVTRRLDLCPLGDGTFRITIQAGRGFLPDDCSHETVRIYAGSNGDATHWLAALQAEHGRRVRHSGTAHKDGASVAIAVLAFPKATT